MTYRFYKGQKQNWSQKQTEFLLKNQPEPAATLKENIHLSVLNAWARDTVMWNWSADTPFWHLSFDHNMGVQYQVN